MNGSHQICGVCQWWLALEQPNWDRSQTDSSHDTPVDCFSTSSHILSRHSLYQTALNKAVASDNTIRIDNTSKEQIARKVSKQTWNHEDIQHQQTEENKRKTTLTCSRLVIAVVSALFQSLVEILLENLLNFAHITFYSLRQHVESVLLGLSTRPMTSWIVWRHSLRRRTRKLLFLAQSKYGHFRLFPFGNIPGKFR